MKKGCLFDVIHNEKPNKDTNLLKKSWILKVQIMIDTCQGMYYLHSQPQPIIHRDLKSFNLLIDYSWTTKVSDFGSSRIKKQTETMTQVGTPQWMAPEVLLGERYSEKADIFSFGVVVWELITHETPWNKFNSVQVISKVAYENQRLVVPPSAPKILTSIIASCFKDEPSERPTFQSLQKLLEEMKMDFRNQEEKENEEN